MNHLSLQQIFEFIDGEIPAGERAAMQKHFDECAVCQAELLAHQTLTETARKIPLEPINEYQLSAIMNLVMNDVPQTQRALAPLKSAIVLAPKRTLIWGIPLRRMIGFAVFAAGLSILVNVPQSTTPRQVNPTIHTIISTYSDWLQVFTHSIVGFFAPLAAIIPVKSVSTLGLLLVAALLLWALDRVFQKRFHIHA
jgi:hypothetical protein